MRRRPARKLIQIEISKAVQRNSEVSGKSGGKRNILNPHSSPHAGYGGPAQVHIVRQRHCIGKTSHHGIDIDNADVIKHRRPFPKPEIKVARYIGIQMELRASPPDVAETAVDARSKSGIFAAANGSIRRGPAGRHVGNHDRRRTGQTCSDDHPKEVNSVLEALGSRV